MTEYTLVPMRIAEIGEYKFIACKNGTGWLLVTDKELEVIQKINNVATIKELALLFPEIGYGALKHLITLLEEQRFIISKKSLTHTHCSHCNSVTKKKVPHTFVVKVTEQCNLECLYCYASASVQKTSKMSLETLCRIIDQAVDLHKEDGEVVTILYHGGEPLLNVEILKQACQYAVKTYGDRVEFGMQTNGTLLTDEVVEFIKQYNVHMGVSLDGPAHVNNITRCGKNNTPSYHRVVRGIEKLNEAQIGFGICSVIHGYNWNAMEEMIYCYLQYGIRNYSFIPIFPAGRSQENDGLYLDSEHIFEAFRTAMEAIIRHNAACDANARIRERFLYCLAEKIILHTDYYMCMRTPCGAGIEILGIDVNGNVYICDDFSDNPDFCIGNVWNVTLDEMIKNSPLIAKLHCRTMQDNTFCKECPWQGICGGVCLGQIHFTKEIGMDVPILCELKKKLIPYIISKYQEYPDLLYLLGSEVDKVTPVDYKIALEDDGVDAQVVDAVLSLYYITPKDTFTLYGAEMDTSEHLFSILERLTGLTTTVKIPSCLVTNQRFVENLLHSSLSILQIQLQKSDMENAHVIESMKALFDEKKEQNQELEIEFLLNATDYEMYRFIIETFAVVDGIRLYLPTSESVWDMEESLNALLDIARETNTEEWIRFENIPICFLHPRNAFFLPAQTNSLQNRKTILLNSDCIIGCDSSVTEEEIAEECKNCEYLGDCGFVYQTMEV